MKFSLVVAAGLLAGAASFSATAKDVGPTPEPKGDVSMISQEAANYCANLYYQCYQQTGDSNGCQSQYQQCIDYYRNADPYGNKPRPPELPITAPADH